MNVWDSISRNWSMLAALQPGPDGQTSHFQPVASDHLVLIVPVAHRLAESNAICFADVTDEQFVGLEVGSTLQDHIDQLAADLHKPLISRSAATNALVNFHDMIHSDTSAGALAGTIDDAVFRLETHDYQEYR